MHVLECYVSRCSAVHEDGVLHRESRQLGEICFVCCAHSVCELLLDGAQVESVLVDDEAAAVGQSAHMKTASCALLNLVAVLADDVHQSLAHDSISCNEEVDVLSASAVEELVVDGADGSFCVLG